MYNSNSEFKGIAEIILGKQRNGPIDTIRLSFEGECSRFSDFGVLGIFPPKKT